MTHGEFVEQFPREIAGYQASDESKKHISQLHLLMFVGPSGSGKTTLIRSLEDSGVLFVPSDVTRGRRIGETDGVDYNFREDYQAVIDEIHSGQFIQIAQPAFGGDFYATKASSYPEHGTATMAVFSSEVLNFRRLGFSKTTSICPVAPSYELLLTRMGAHNFDEDKTRRRLSEAARSLAFCLQDPEMNFVLNDTVDDALAQIHSILEESPDEVAGQKSRRLAAKQLEQLKSS